MLRGDCMAVTGQFHKSDSTADRAAICVPFDRQNSPVPSTLRADLSACQRQNVHPSRCSSYVSQCSRTRRTHLTLYTEQATGFWLSKNTPDKADPPTIPGMPFACCMHNVAQHPSQCSAVLLRLSSRHTASCTRRLFVSRSA